MVKYRSSSAKKPAVESRMRLQKFIAHCGVASRRKAEELITSGKVRVNGNVVTELGTSVNPQKDRVQVRNKSISMPHLGVLLFYKPRGVVSTLSDPEGRPNLSDYLTKHFASYFPVGRLDFDSSGLMILTNDGEMAERLMHPRYEFERTYLARVAGSVSHSVLEKLARGVRLVDGPAKAQARIVAPPRDVRRPGAREPEEVSTWIEITVGEGRNRLVRRIMERVEHPVIKLRRIAHGPFHIGKLKPGQMRQLTQEEYERIRRKIVRN